jgi:hypothetical protein
MSFAVFYFVYQKLRHVMPDLLTTECFRIFFAALRLCVKKRFLKGNLFSREEPFLRYRKISRKATKYARICKDSFLISIYLVKLMQKFASRTWKEASELRRIFIAYRISCTLYHCYPVKKFYDALKFCLRA